MSEGIEQPPPSGWSTAPAVMPPGAMYTTQDFSALSHASLPDAPIGLSIAGRPTDAGQPGARLSAESRCATCGGKFAKGDIVRLGELAMDWDAAKFWHARCSSPAPTLQPSMRYRGWGMTAAHSSANLPAKLQAFKALD